MFGRALSVPSQDAGGVGVVDHHERVVAIRKVTDLVERGQVPVHTEHTVGRDETEPRVGCFFELRFEIGQFGVGVDVALRFAETDAINNAGVVEGVTQNRVFGPEEGFEKPSVCIEAGRIEDGVVGLEEL